MKKRKRENYLDFVPVINPRNTWDEKKSIVTIHMVNRGFAHTIAQKLFRSPRVSHIALDQYGSFLWKKIDGVRTVGDLANEMKAQFGDKAEPLYDRLIHYMKILHNNRFILYQGKDKIKS
ncbi:PqqD family protein [Clostridium minihomine]|uniref:PqqD family protein n=1 Tax=Clostridium minihomine TaxID=2045012 RepID=UPI000C758899|nr:PqqD family protein [Clostridium minihomine]